MLEKPVHWRSYLHGNTQSLTYGRKYSLSDRIRYYWQNSYVQTSIEKMINNLHEKPLPHSILSQFSS